MVLGDFNSHSPFDGSPGLDNPGLLKNVRASDLKSKDYNNLLDEEFDYSVMASFIAYPLIDVTQRFVKTQDRFTYPAKVHLIKQSSMQFNRQQTNRLRYQLN